jgi:hypothetical protein
MTRKAMLAAAAVAALLGLGASAGAADAGTSPPAQEGFPSVFRSGVAGEISAVTAVSYGGGKVAQFAFTTSGGKPAMYSRTNNGSWGLTTIPAVKAGEVVTAARAVGPDEVLLFTRIGTGAGGRVIRYTATRSRATFTVMKAFPAAIGTASVISATDVWVFGSSAHGAGKLGVWHYNGHTWKQLAATLADGAAENDTHVWAVTGTTIAFYNGTKWTATSAAPLLSGKTPTAASSLSFVYAGPGNAVYALAAGNRTADQGGPLTLLRYTGSTWAKAASSGHGRPVPGAAATDGGIEGNNGITEGSQGIFFPIDNGPSRAPQLVHYATNIKNVLTTIVAWGVTNVPGARLLTIANVPGSQRELVGGFAPNTGTGPATYAKAYSRGF